MPQDLLVQKLEIIIMSRDYLKRELKGELAELKSSPSSFFLAAELFKKIGRLIVLHGDDVEKAQVGKFIEDVILKEGFEDVEDGVKPS